MAMFVHLQIRYHLPVKQLILLKTLQACRELKSDICQALSEQAKELSQSLWYPYLFFVQAVIVSMTFFV